MNADVDGSHLPSAKKDGPSVPGRPAAGRGGNHPGCPERGGLHQHGRKRAGRVRKPLLRGCLLCRFFVRGRLVPGAAVRAGALVDLAGQVIGIPTLAAADPQLGGAAAGIGFAIPSDTVTSIAGQLIAVGKVSNSGRASLGITAQTVADATGQPAGAGVVSVTSGGAAARAGIMAGDIITVLAGQPIASVAALQSVLAAHKPGDRVQARLSRDDAASTVTVALGTLGSLTS